MLFERLGAAAVFRVPLEFLAEEPRIFDEGFRVVLDLIVHAEHEGRLFLDFLIDHSIELFLLLHQRLLPAPDLALTTLTYTD